MNPQFSTTAREPAACAAVESKDEPKHQPSGPGARRKRVLLIDKEVAFSRILKMTLELDPAYEVWVENDPHLALATGSKFSPDIIILDVGMPHFDGDGVQEQFKADPNFKEIPFLVLTTMANEKELEEYNGRSEGLVYVAKPVSARRLIDIIEKHVRL